jgi:hypothetical protein
MDFYTYVFNKASTIFPKDRAHQIASYIVLLPPTDTLHQSYFKAFKEDVYTKTKSIRYLNRKEEVLNQN